MLRTALAVGISKPPGIQRKERDRLEILAEDHALAAESASGYAKLADSQFSSANLLILPAVRQLTLDRAWDLRKQALNGRWILLESGLGFSTKEEQAEQARTLRRVFDIRARHTVDSVEWRGDYVEYVRPARHMVRPFGAITLLESSLGKVLARWKGMPVSTQLHVGLGGLVFLGSALGIGLNASEKQAWAVGSALIVP